MASEREPELTPAKIDEAWLRAGGFKWHEVDRSGKHWLLWIGCACGKTVGHEDLGIEVAPWRGGDTGEWFVWLRADYSGRYSRFLHVRHMRYCSEIVALFEGLTGQRWDTRNHLYGNAYTPEVAERLHAESDRLDRRIAETTRWAGDERDDSRAGAKKPATVASHEEPRP